MNDSRKLIKNTTIYALGDILPRMLSFVTLPIITLYLTPADYGVLNYVNALLLVLMTVGFLCVNTYYLVFYYRQKDEIAQKRLLGNLSVFVTIFNVVIVAVLMLFGPWFFGAMESNIDFYPYIAIGVGTHFMNIFSVLPSALFRLQERPLLFTVLNTSRGFLQLLLTLLLVVVCGYDAIGVLWANFIVSACFAVVFVAITFRHAILCIDWRQIGVVLRFSLPLLPGSISYFLVSMSDRILIDKYLDLTALGIYGLASTLAMLLNIVSNGAYKAFEPHFFKTYGSSGFVAMFAKVRNAYAYVLLFGAFGLAMFAREFFEVMSSDAYHDAYFYVPMMVIGLFASGLSLMYATIVTARGKTKISAAIMVGGGCLSVGLNILLLPRFGIIGSSLVSSLTFSLMLMATVYFSQIRVGFSRIIISLIIAAVATYIGVYMLVIDDFWLRLTIKTVLFVGANLVILYTMGLTLQKLRRAFK